MYNKQKANWNNQHVLVSKVYVKILQITTRQMTENSETICAFTVSVEHKTTYAHSHMFFFPHEENIPSKPGLKI